VRKMLKSPPDEVMQHGRDRCHVRPNMPKVAS
jgi:hypothetical protein